MRSPGPTRAAAARRRDLSGRTGLPRPGEGGGPGQGSRQAGCGRGEASRCAEADSGRPRRIASQTGSGYSGPLAYRQGKPMRPDVARAFDRLAAAARADGVDLTSLRATARTRSRRSSARHPDPKWVAPPGRSLHRFGTELDLGPPAAYAWLARNGKRFHFVQRYSWEPWHYGYGLNPRSAPAVADGRSAVPLRAGWASAISSPAPQPLERFRSAAGSADLRRERLQPVRRVARRGARHRAVHARHGAHVRPRTTPSTRTSRSRRRRT